MAGAPCSNGGCGGCDARCPTWPTWRTRSGLISAAKAPLIVTGGGTIYAEATDELAAFASRFGIPVVETQAGKGALTWDHPLNAGPIGTNGGLAANRLGRDADLVIGVGTRMGDFVTASRTTFQNPDVEFIGINIGPLDAHKLGGTPIVADAREALLALDSGLSAAGYGGTSAPYRRASRTSSESGTTSSPSLRTVDGEPGDLGQAEVIGIVNDAVGGHATVICAAGSLPGDLLRLWRVDDPRPITSNTASRAWATRSPPGWASAWPTRTARSS